MLAPRYPLFSLHYQYEPLGAIFLRVISIVSENPNTAVPKCNREGFPKSYYGQKLIQLF